MSDELLTLACIALVEFGLKFLTPKALTLNFQPFWKPVNFRLSSFAVFADLVSFSVVFCVVAADVVISWVTGAVVSSTQLSVITSEKSLMLPTASEAARLSSKASTSGARVLSEQQEQLPPEIPQ